MKLEDVIDRVREIRRNQNDPERAHSMEDDLHRDVLKAIAEDDCEEPRVCAETALDTLYLDFPRWCS